MACSCPSDSSTRARRRRMASSGTTPASGIGWPGSGGARSWSRRPSADQAHGGRQHRPVRSLRRKQQDRRPHIYAGLIPSEVEAFVPTLAAALFVSDCVTTALLFAQFAILRQWALLVIASGYLFSALIVVAHALTFPGAFTPTGVLGSGLQSAVWLYWFWHAGLPVAVIGYALLKDTDGLADV